MAQEGGYYILRADSCFVWQKPPQHCKAIILNLKKERTKSPPKNGALKIVYTTGS